MRALTADPRRAATGFIIYTGPTRPDQSDALCSRRGPSERVSPNMSVCERVENSRAVGAGGAALPLSP